MVRKTAISSQVHVVQAIVHYR